MSADLDLAFFIPTLPNIMNKFIYILTIFLCFQSCRQNTENKLRLASDKAIEKRDSTEINHKKVKNTEVKNPDSFALNRDSVNEFLKQPFDLIKFKEKKRSSNSGVGKKKDYYLKPKKEGMYYQYFLFSRQTGYTGTNKDNIIRKADGLGITVYKELGQYRYDFIDPTEELIEVRAKFNDFDLPELAYIGLDSAIVIKKLGKVDFYQKNCLVYQFENNVLILNILNKKVNWLKYTKTKKGINITDIDDIFNMKKVW